jgi:hypothetical protein
MYGRAQQYAKKQSAPECQARPDVVPMDSRKHRNIKDMNLYMKAIQPIFALPKLLCHSFCSPNNIQYLR